MLLLLILLMLMMIMISGFPAAAYAAYAAGRGYSGYPSFGLPYPAGNQHSLALVYHPLPPLESLPIHPLHL